MIKSPIFRRLNFCTFEFVLLAGDLNLTSLAENLKFLRLVIFVFFLRDFYTFECHINGGKFDSSATGKKTFFMRILTDPISNVFYTFKFEILPGNVNLEFYTFEFDFITGNFVKSLK